MQPLKRNDRGHLCEFSCEFQDKMEVAGQSIGLFSVTSHFMQSAKWTPQISIWGIFNWFIPVVCEYNVKYLRDTRRVRQNTTRVLH